MLFKDIKLLPWKFWRLQIQTLKCRSCWYLNNYSLKKLKEYKQKHKNITCCWCLWTIKLNK